jgi:hypothetical protein
MGIASLHPSCAFSFRGYDGFLERDALPPGHESPSHSKHFQFINLLETIMGDQ